MPIGRKTTLGVLAVLGVAAFAQTLYATRNGIGLSFDPVIYLTVATNLLSGSGLTQAGAPLTHFPPLYPLWLSLAGSLVGKLELGARLLNALLWGANTVLVGLIVYRATSRRAWLSILASVLICLSPVMFELHVFALSEPAFIFLSLLALWWLQHYEEQRRPGLLWASATAAALAFITRYVGGTLVACGSLWLLGDRSRPWRARVADVLQFGTIASLPMAIWMLRNLLVAGTAAPRTLYWHPVTLSHLVEALETVSQFVAPAREPSVACGAIATGAVLAATAWLVRSDLNANRPSAARNPRTLSTAPYALFSVVYLAGLVVSVSLFDALTPFSARILAPIYVALLIVVLAASDSATRTNSRIRPVLGLAPFAVLALVYALHTLPAAYDANHNGLGWAHRNLQESEFVRYVDALPQDVPLLTNNRNELSLMTGRTGTQLAHKYNLFTHVPDPQYSRRWERAIANIRSQDGLLIWISVKQRAPYKATLEELLEIAPFEVLLQTEEGIVLRPLRKTQSPTPTSPTG